MTSVEDTEVFIPQQARVVTVPARSLPSSVTKKMPLSPAHSDRPATFISPVELRIKGTTLKPRPLTPGQFFLPVLTSNCEAFKILRDFLLSGQASPQVSESPGAGSAFCRRRNSIVLFNKQIFLIVRKAKESKRSPALSECEAPPMSSCVKTQDGGSDITEGRSKEDKQEAEDDGVMECEALDDDITDRKRSKDGTDAAEDDGKRAEVLKENEADVTKDGEENYPQPLTKDANTNTPSFEEKIMHIKLEKETSACTPSGEAQSSPANAEDCDDGEDRITLTLTESSATESSLAKTEYCKRVTFSRVQSPSATSENEHQGKSYFKGQISELEIPQDKTEASVRAAEVVEVNIAHRAAQENAGDASEDRVKSTPSISIQTSKGQSSHCECADETVNISSEDNVESGDANAVRTNGSKVEHLLEIVESLKQGIDDGINDQASSVGLEKCKNDDIAVETGAERNGLISEKSCAEVESVSAGRHMEVIECIEPDRHTSGDESQGNETGAETKREGPVSTVTNSSVEAKGCEGAVQIPDTADSHALHKSTNDTNREKSCAGVKCPSLALKHCDGPVEIVDDNDNDENDTESGNPLGLQTRDGAKGCKRKIFTRITDETSLDVAAVARISENDISSAKRCKYDDDDDDDDDIEFLSESKPIVKHKHKAKNHDLDVVIIEDDDNEDDKINRSSNSTNEISSLSVSSLDECDLEILDVRGCRGDDVELQSILEKMKSRKRCVSDSEDVEVCTEGQINETEDSSTKRFKTEDATNSGAKTGGKSAGARDQDDQINNKTLSETCISEAERLLTRNDVEILTSRNSDEVSRKSGDETIIDGTDYNSAAAGPISEVENSSGTNNVIKTVSGIEDTHKEDQANNANGVETDCVEGCVKSHVSEVQSQSAEQERVTNGGVCGDSRVSEDQSAVQDRDFAAKSDSKEPNRDGTTRDLSAHGTNNDAAAQKEDEDLEPGGVRDTPTPDVTASRSYAAPQTGKSSETREHCKSDPESQPPGPDQDGKLAEEQSEAPNQSARAEEAVVMPRPTSPFTELRREENISRIRAKIRGMEEKLNNLINSHR